MHNQSCVDPLFLIGTNDFTFSYGWPCPSSHSEFMPIDGEKNGGRSKKTSSKGQFGLRGFEGYGLRRLETLTLSVTSQESNSDCRSWIKERPSVTTGDSVPSEKLFCCGGGAARGGKGGDRHILLVERRVLHPNFVARSWQNAIPTRYGVMQYGTLHIFSGSSPCAIRFLFRISHLFAYCPDLTFSRLPLLPPPPQLSLQLTIRTNVSPTG